MQCPGVENVVMKELPQCLQESVISETGFNRLLRRITEIHNSGHFVCFLLFGCEAIM